jgi:peptidoglycan/xylan/chitin deacetylase (PgdA/CDA1 family)
MRLETSAMLSSVLLTALLGGGGLMLAERPVDEIPLKTPNAPIAPFHVPETKEEGADKTARTSEMRAPILVYHAVRELRPEDGPDARAFNTTPEAFERQMSHLAENGYEPVSFDDLLSAIMEGGELPEKPVLLTFDDGSESQYLNAFPVLKKHGFTATFFLFSNAVGRPGWFRTSWIEEMSGAGMRFEGHTRYHPYLTRVSDERELDAEIAGSRTALEKLTGRPVRHLAYPFGLYDERIIEKAKEAGYLTARAIREGSVHGPETLYELRAWQMNSDFDRFLRALGGQTP